tara:strand:- start:493 stop:696 length:204 start_codon:yes stop_codon:yes gene_type:complete
MKQYIKTVVVSINMLIASLLGGEMRMSLSALTAKRGWDRLAIIINKMFSEPNHCWESYMRHLKRAKV